MTKVEILGDSPEAVAYALFSLVRDDLKQIGSTVNEHGMYVPNKENEATVQRKEWILSTYAECLKAVKSSKA